MKKSLIWIIVAIIIVLAFVYFAGFWQKKASQENQGSEQDENISTEADSLSVELFMRNESGQAGWAIFTKEANGTKVEISSWGFPENTEQPADIRSGSCEDPSNQKYSLNPLASGKSETILNESIDDILSQLPIAISLYRSNQERQIVSCGDLQ